MPLQFLCWGYVLPNCEREFFVRSFCVRYLKCRAFQGLSIDLSIIEIRCFALELCAATLHDYCTGKYNGTMPNEWECLLDMADGLQYIHSKNIVHGDIKPRNILISLPDEDGSVRIKISDFGLCRQISERYRFSLDPIKGSPIYLAPEVLQSLEKKAGSWSCSGDVFSLGCTYFFFLTKGTHPFGSTLFLSAVIPKATRNTSSELLKFTF